MQSYTEARTVLEASKMHLTFLSLDVVGSTKMKQGEDPYVIEQVSDSSIDITGHMQKYADHDTFWISKDLYEVLTDKTGFEALDKEVDGKKVYCWRLESIAGSS